MRLPGFSETLFSKEKSLSVQKRHSYSFGSEGPFLPKKRAFIEPGSQAFSINRFFSVFRSIPFRKKVRLGSLHLTTRPQAHLTKSF